MATYRYTPHNHLQAHALYETHANRLSHRVVLGHQTYLERANDVAEGAFAIRHFASRVLVFHPNGLLTVASGGYATVSTTERLNVFSPEEMHFRRRASTKHLIPGEITLFAPRAGSAAACVLHRFVEGDREAIRLRRVTLGGGWTWEFDQ
jgi:hypothetical protein